MREYGGPDVLEVQEIHRPEPIQTEVLVRVTAVGINPVDTKVRRYGGDPRAVVSRLSSSAGTSPGS
jgi:NADPH:quinone reductase-like Zn-dependent oxidoreductase